MSWITLNPNSPFYSPLDPPFDEWPEPRQPSTTAFEYHHILSSSMTQFLHASQLAPHPTPHRKKYTHPPKEINKFRCPVVDCKSKFELKSILKTHLINMHAMGDADLKRILLTPKSKKPHPCPVAGCPNGYQDKSQLKRHLFCKHKMKDADLKGILPKIIPISERQYRCPVNYCERAYRHIRDLKKHLKEKHPEIKV